VPAGRQVGGLPRRDVDAAPLYALAVITRVASLAVLFALLLVIAEVMNVLPIFNFDVVSWRDFLLFVLGAAIWYWLLGLELVPRILRTASKLPAPVGAWARHLLHLILLFAAVHVLNNAVFVSGVLISVWSEINFTILCHVLAQLLWRAGGRPVPARASR